MAEMASLLGSERNEPGTLSKKRLMADDDGASVGLADHLQIAVRTTTASNTVLRRVQWASVAT